MHSSYYTINCAKISLREFEREKYVKISSEIFPVISITLPSRELTARKLRFIVESQQLRAALRSDLRNEKLRTAKDYRASHPRRD